MTMSNELSLRNALATNRSDVLRSAQLGCYSTLFKRLGKPRRGPLVGRADAGPRRAGPTS